MKISRMNIETKFTHEEQWMFQVSMKESTQIFEMFWKTVFIGYVILFCGVVFKKLRYLLPSPSETSSTYDFSLGPSLVRNTCNNNDRVQNC
jgi:hypothetical protein